MLLLHFTAHYLMSFTALHRTLYPEGPSGCESTSLIPACDLLCHAGYGFSSAPQERGCGVTAMAGIMDSLMAALGYTRYIAQVGVVGGVVVWLAGHAHLSCLDLRQWIT
jgi:hypothetical protein